MAPRQPNDPRREPSWKPDPRGVKKSLGVRIYDSLRPPPPSVRIDEKGAASKSNTRRNIGISGTVLAGLLLGLWQGLPRVLEATKGGPEKAPELDAAGQQCATQASLVETQARVTRLEKNMKYHLELLCKLNGGNPGAGATCTEAFFYANRNPPPINRTDYLYSPTTE